MKSLFKIFRYYIFTAAFITLSILFLNVVVYGAFVLNYSTNSSTTSRVSQISEELIEKDNVVHMSKKGLDLLHNKYAWAMLLDNDGHVIWDWQLPSDFKSSYTAPEIASFSRWYLNDYPVNVWSNQSGLLVIGNMKDSLWKMNIEVPMGIIKNFLHIILFSFYGNILLVLVLVFSFGYKFYKSLRPIATGIENLAKQEIVTLPEKGIMMELSQKLNETSSILEKQNKFISKRDTARTNWISGISHDIRTPLSMIIGYSESLENHSKLSTDQKNQLSIIKRQSIKIKHLIEDLNLTSKLQYNMQPLRISQYAPASLLRNIVVNYYNNGLEDKYSINLTIDSPVESLILTGDIPLLTRAYNNIINNSISHNKDGCSIIISSTIKDNIYSITFMDNGCGIPSNVIDCLNSEDTYSENQPHVMGLRVVKQIILAHNGIIEFSSSKEMPCIIDVKFPFDK